MIPSASWTRSTTARLLPSASLRLVSVILLNIFHMWPCTHRFASAVRLNRWTFSSSHDGIIQRPHWISTVLAFQSPRNIQLSSLLSSSPLSRRSRNPQAHFSSSKIFDNETLVQRRLHQAQEKQRARQASKLEIQTRHLKTKSILQSDPSLSNNLIAVKVTVDATLRNELKMNGREKRGRMFLTPTSDSCTSIQGLKKELHEFFRSLKKSSFVLKAGLPRVMEDGSIVSPEDDYNDSLYQKDTFWPIEDDQDVIETLAKAQEFYSSYKQLDETHSDTAKVTLKRPSFILRVEKDPMAPTPPPPPPYLQHMADPSKTDSMTMLSFYAFPPKGIDNPEDFASLLKKAWKPFHALGRVYVAPEGINAQMSVPSNVLENFMSCCRSIPELGSYMENGINIDPIRLTMDEFSVAGDMNGKPAPPFRALHIRVRNQVVADGLDYPLNWQSAGYDMPPLEWHEKLVHARDRTKSNHTGESMDIPIILDCRNKYETNVGRFVGAEPLDTESFRETWDALKDRLRDTPKDAPIMTYCTGGIRCVKVGAYLTQEMGFTNVSRLAGGIISYDRAINSHESDIESMFKGTNYVFDGRVGRQITDDALADCVTCGEKTSLISNCNNENCHKRITQCNRCRSSFMGTCSDACKIRVLNSGMRPGRVEDTFFSTQPGSSMGTKRFQDLDEYSAAHSSCPSAVYNEIIENTKAFLQSGAHMVSGAQQGRLLTSLASMTREGRILELGTFTGYATSCFLEGATNVAASLNYSSCGERMKGPFVLSLERDVRAFSLAVRHLQVISSLGWGQDSIQQLSQIRDQDIEDIQVDVDSVSLKFKNAGCEIVRVNDALAYVEALSVSDDRKMSPFDIIFVDADKTRLPDYMEVFLKNDRILKKGGAIIVDNVLWKGAVVGTADEPTMATVDPNQIDTMSFATEAELKKSRRARKLANIMHQFNTNIMKDARVEVVILPIRDGLSLIRKRV